MKHTDWEEDDLSTNWWFASFIFIAMLALLLWAGSMDAHQPTLQPGNVTVTYHG